MVATKLKEYIDFSNDKDIDVDVTITIKEGNRSELHSLL